MTSKELLYVEDALGHEQYFQTKCSEVAQTLTDSELKNTVCEMQSKHREIFNNFMNVLD